MGWAPTTDQILNLDGVRRRSDSFVFELCDRNLVPIGTLHPDRGNPMSVEVDTSSATRRLRGLRLMPDEVADVNVLSDRLRVYMVLQNDVRFRLGTFLWGDANRPVRSWGDEQHSDLVDMSWVLAQPVTQAFGWGTGGRIWLIMLFLLLRAGFQAEDVAVIGSEADRGLAEPVSWQPGTTWAQMLGDLCNIVGFAPPWFDRDGLVHLDQPPDPARDPATVPAYEAGGRIVADSIVRSDDLLAAPNDFAVFTSSGERIIAGRSQLPTSAPHSFATRGFRVGLVESAQGLETQDQANKAAATLARTKSVAFEWLSWSSTLDPRHDVWDVVDVLGDRWLETRWSMELKSGGQMSHTARRTTYAL